jgi:hypothetical protein
MPGEKSPGLCFRASASGRCAPWGSNLGGAMAGPRAPAIFVGAPRHRVFSCATQISLWLAPTMK